jgi:hypothetical protein
MPLLEKQLADTDKAITNMLDAIQQGDFHAFDETAASR